MRRFVHASVASRSLKTLVDVALLPYPPPGTPGISKFVAACGGIFDKHGLNHAVHSWGTNVEGDWDVVMQAVRECHENAHDLGCERVISSWRVETGSKAGIQSTMGRLEAAKKKAEGC
mmetsp:Transcript_9101/g.26421  ORF Transcript_9101/g.26421 Transcript_9101/m.26421 type:complete len:118 (-) Transcript_9101:321-674(-)